ncbi:hypothetical protein LAZ67_4002055 [Cordylochernes scorpioides]|uniref:Reverse transcriptase domain-containing protein n=1 Tax=Cordylochernes scorpioides TaxID=51811 RepID=A0ABY6KFI5_9ARAC|nr:hypothetical protein LAZ67_4002055 [Cordylochernes scorpioides]
MGWPDIRTVFYRSDHSYFEELQDELLSSYIDPLELTEGTERELDDFRTVFYRSDHSYFEELQDEVLSSYIDPLELTEGIEEKFDDFNIESYRRRRGRENNEEEEVQNFKDPIKEGILKSLPQQAQELLKYGMPGVHHISLMGDDLVIGYDTALRVPRWVLEHLTPDSLSGGHFKRKGSDFFEDKSIHPYFRSTTQDYKGSGFDRGHMAAAGNHKKSSGDYKDTFILSNMAPQVGEDFNRGIWNNLEIYVRDKFVTKYDETFVLTGTLFLPRFMAYRQHLSQEKKWQAIGRMEADQSQAEVARWLGVTRNVVSRVCKKFQTTANVARTPGKGRPRVTTLNQDRYLSLLVRRNRRITASQLRSDLNADTGVIVSTDTIRRRLHKKGLYARRPIICVPLTPPQKRARKLCCRQHVAWSPDEWRRVMFTDESRFSLNSDSRRVFFWREVETRNNPRNMVERDPYRSQGFMVWAGIFLGGRTALHIFRQGTLTGQRYRDEILAAYVMPQALEMGENFLLMDDNARPHRAGVVDTFLQNHAIARMNWPAQSPDLNPIEHMNDVLTNVVFITRYIIKTVLRTCKKTSTYVFPRDAAERDLASTETFDFSTPNEWPKWRKRFERYLVVSGMKKKEEADKIDLFMYLMGDRADDIFRTFKFEKKEEATKIDSVLKAFDSHFCVRKNIIYERAKFNSRIQEDREPVEEFITSLYKLADSCEFEGLHEQLIRDRIVVGVRDKALSERMQLDSELTLEKAVKMVRQQEAVRQQQVDLQRPSASHKVNQVKFNSKNQSPKQQQQPSGKKEKSAKTRSRCPKCGGFTHREGQACRAEGQRCNLCSKTGHFANCCPDKQAKTAEVKAVSELDEEIGFLLEVSAVEDSSNLDDDERECRRRWTAEIQVNGKKVKFKLDSQADVTCVPLCLFKKIMGQQRLVKSDINIRAAEFSELQTVGMFISTLRNGNYEIKEKIYVIRRLSEPLLSRRACELLNLARRIEVVATRINPIKEFPEVFEGLGQIGNPYEIKLKPGAKPYAVHTPRRVPIPLMEKLKTRLEELEKAGIIAQVNVATEWCAPTVIAGKPNGDIRLCVDLSRLNEHVQREVHPMPVVEHMLGQLGEARFFSKLDANSGFHQIPLSPDCQHLTTFITPFGRYKYCRMPFGISLAPEYFQRVMSIILQGMDGVMCYLDDILIFASDSKTHDRILRLVLRKLKEAKVTLNKAKCVFGVPRINFLGHILDEDGIRPDPAKIEAVA